MNPYPALKIKRESKKKLVKNHYHYKRIEQKSVTCDTRKKNNQNISLNIPYIPSNSIHMYYIYIHLCFICALFTNFHLKWFQNPIGLLFAREHCTLKLDGDATSTNLTMITSNTTDLLFVPTYLAAKCWCAKINNAREGGDKQIHSIHR